MNSTTAFDIETLVINQKKFFGDMIIIQEQRWIVEQKEFALREREVELKERELEIKQKKLELKQKEQEWREWKKTCLINKHYENLK